MERGSRADLETQEETGTPLNMRSYTEAGDKEIDMWIKV